MNNRQVERLANCEHMSLCKSRESGNPLVSILGEDIMISAAADVKKTWACVLMCAETVSGMSGNGLNITGAPIENGSA